MHCKSIALITLITSMAFVVSVTSAQMVTLQKCDSYVSIKDNNVYEKLQLTYIVPYAIDSDDTRGIWYNDSVGVHSNPTNIEIVDSERNLTYTLKKDNGSDETIINYKFGSMLMGGDKYTVTVTFDRDLEKPADNYAYILAYRWNNTPLHLNVLLKLSGGYEYYNSLKQPDAIFPDEDNLVLQWADYASSRFLTRVTFGEREIIPPENETNETAYDGSGAVEPTNYNIEYIEEPKNDDWKKYAFIPIVLIVIILSVFIHLRIKKSKQEKKKEIHDFAAEKIESILSEAEFAIVSELRAENDLTQAELCRRTQIPKSTMSRTLDKLEDKGILKRMGYGMSNRVRLMKWMV